jgi:hypothetical protein
MNLLIESHFTSLLDCIHTNEGDINETAVDRARPSFHHPISACNAEANQPVLHVVLWSVTARSAWLKTHAEKAYPLG